MYWEVCGVLKDVGDGFGYSSGGRGRAWVLYSCNLTCVLCFCIFYSFSQHLVQSGLGTYISCGMGVCIIVLEHNLMQFFSYFSGCVIVVF